MRTWPYYFLFIILVGLVFFTQKPIDRISLSIFTVFSLAAAVPFYFSSRRHRPPSSLETVFATLWLGFRRVVCFGAALFFAGYGIFLLLYPLQTKTAVENIMLSLSIIVLAGFITYVGVVGQGQRRYDWKDDVELHRENKRRYKWRR